MVDVDSPRAPILGNFSRELSDRFLQNFVNT